MEFEFDSGKSKLNRIKHGIDFHQAQLLWEGPYVEFAAQQEYENRFAVIGQIGDKVYTCIYTVRRNHIRIISCRRARNKERQLYENSIQKT